MKQILIIVFFIAIIVSCSALIATPFINDDVSKKTANELADLPLPGNTELIESVHESGKLVGNGNGMQYFGAILIKSDLSLEELKEYYSSYAENEWDCVVEKQTGADIKIIEHVKFTTEIEGDNYYIVYSWGDNDTIFHEFDIRGH